MNYDNIAVVEYRIRDTLFIGCVPRPQRVIERSSLDVLPGPATFLSRIPQDSTRSLLPGSPLGKASLSGAGQWVLARLRQMRRPTHTSPARRAKTRRTLMTLATGAIQSSTRL
jgi:hypothetical protein